MTQFIVNGLPFATISAPLYPMMELAECIRVAQQLFRYNGLDSEQESVLVGIIHKVHHCLSDCIKNPKIHGEFSYDLTVRCEEDQSVLIYLFNELFPFVTRSMSIDQFEFEGTVNISFGPISDASDSKPEPIEEQDHDQIMSKPVSELGSDSATPITVLEPVIESETSVTNIDDTIDPIYLLTHTELMDHVQERINKSEHKQELLKILADEVPDSDRKYSDEPSSSPDAAPMTTLETHARRSFLANEELLTICRIGELDDIEKLFGFCGHMINRQYHNYAALKLCLKRGNTAMLKLLAGSTYLDWSNNLINEEAKKMATEAAYDSDLNTVTTCLELIKASTEYFCNLITIAGNNGDTNMISLLLDACDNPADYHQELSYAIVASLTSGDENLIYYLIGLYVKAVDAVHADIQPRLTEATHPNNRGILIEIAKTGDYKLFRHVLSLNYHSLNWCVYQTQYIVCWYTVFRLPKPDKRDQAGAELFKICCEQPSSEMVDAFIAKAGRSIGIIRKNLSSFDAACRNGHLSVINIFLADPLSSLRKWITTCVESGLTAAADKIIEKHHDHLASKDPVSLSEPVRTAMKHYYATKAAYYA